MPTADTRERKPGRDAAGAAGAVTTGRTATVGAAGIAGVACADATLTGAVFTRAVFTGAEFSMARRSRRLAGWCTLADCCSPTGFSGVVGPRSAADSTRSVTAVLLCGARGCSRLPVHAPDVEFSRIDNGGFPDDASTTPVDTTPVDEPGGCRGVTRLVPRNLPNQVRRARRRAPSNSSRVEHVAVLASATPFRPGCDCSSRCCTASSRRPGSPMSRHRRANAV